MQPALDHFINSPALLVLTCGHGRGLLLPLDLCEDFRSLLQLLFHLLERPLLLADSPEPDIALLVTQHPVWLHSDEETFLEPEIEY